MIIKRNKSKEEFSTEKIEKALLSAFISCGYPNNKYTKRRCRKFAKSILPQQVETVEDVQDKVEDLLMSEHFYDVAKTYIIYREKHNKLREFTDNKLNFINKYKNSNNTANATVDDNSNVNGKNIGILNSEIHKEDNIQVSRRMIVEKLRELYPNFDAKQYIRDLEHHIIYKNDESSFAGAISPYCVSSTMYPFLINGLKNIGGLSASPKNLDSFCGMYINFIFAVSAMFAGAVATPEVLLYFTYFCKKEWGNDFYLKADNIITTNGRREKTIRSQIHQYWQQIVYSINQPSAARGLQSAFVNFAYFDKEFFKGMFGGFYFPDGTRPDWESLNWIQKEFMQWFNAERLKCMLTFPVESFALIYKDNEFKDEESAKFVAEEYARGHSFFTYISDTVDSLSSCCFTEDTKCWFRSTEDSENIVLTFKEAYTRYNNKEVFVYNPYRKEFQKAKIIKTSIAPRTEISFKLQDNTQLLCTNDHIFPIRGKGDLKAEEIQVEDFFILDMDKTLGILSIDKYNTNKEYYCFQFIDEIELPYFTLTNGIITHNCRLKNKIKTKEFNFTNGNMGIQTGSKSVITLNINRIIQDWWNTKETKEYNIDIIEEISKTEVIADCYRIGDKIKSIKSLKEYITSILERVYKYHIAYNELLWDMYDANLLPVYKAGFIDLNKQYLTIGLNGLNQAAEFLGISCNDNKEYKDFCQLIFSIIKENNTKNKGKFNNHVLTFNTECVPAESLAVKNYNWDKEDNYKVPSDTNLYASYIFKPNDANISVLDKFKLHGKDYIGDFLDGGAACHVNLENHLSAKQYYKLLNYSAEVGCQYFTFNVPNSECDDCGYITKVPINKCPKCGSEHINYYDRVIGYLTKISNWSEGRQIEQKTRVYNKIQE